MEKVNTEKRKYNILVALLIVMDVELFSLIHYALKDIPMVVSLLCVFVGVIGTCIKTPKAEVGKNLICNILVIIGATAALLKEINLNVVILLTVLIILDFVIVNLIFKKAIAKILCNKTSVICYVIVIVTGWFINYYCTPNKITGTLSIISVFILITDCFIKFKCTEEEIFAQCVKEELTDGCFQISEIKMCEIIQILFPECIAVTTFAILGGIAAMMFF